MGTRNCSTLILSSFPHYNCYYIIKKPKNETTSPFNTFTKLALHKITNFDLPSQLWIVKWNFDEHCLSAIINAVRDDN